MNAPTTNDVPAEGTAEQLAEAMFQARKSKAEVWQALVDKKFDAATATATINAVATRYEVRCSACDTSVLSSDTTLSNKGEPICPSCVQGQKTAEMYERAKESANTNNQLRRCRRCGKSMDCVDYFTWYYRWQSITTFTFQCRSCFHRFTGYEGTLPVTFIAIAVGVMVFALNDARSDVGSLVQLVAAALVILFFVYRYVVWFFYPVTAWAGAE